MADAKNKGARRRKPVADGQTAVPLQAPPTPRVRRARAPAKSPAAVLALADDPRVSDVMVAAELFALAPSRRRHVVGAWTDRVAAGEAALVTRLLAMFELAALGATDPE